MREEVKNNTITKIMLISIVSICISLFFENYLIILEERIPLMNLATLSIWEQILSCFSIARFLCIFISIFLLVLYIVLAPAFVKEFIYRYRYIIALIIFVIGVCIEIHGSSIGMWIEYATGENHNSILGVPRAIRSDEWAVNTPILFSQYFNMTGEFPYFSETLRGTLTDTFIVYGQPVWDIAVLFRPFHWGYLFLEPAKGLSFFWLGRIIALFMVSFEMGMLISKKNKLLSCSLAFLITWSPCVQWWFGTSGLIEMLIFGQLAVLLIYKYVKIKNYLKRLIYAILLVVCGGGYITMFYPAWAISFGYVFLALIIWIITENYKESTWSYKDVVIFLIFLVLLGGILAYIFFKSSDAVISITNTVAPGKRIVLGGGGWYKFFNYVGTLFYPLGQDSIPANVCEQAVFYDFFPISILLPLYVILFEKNRDKLLICLTTCYVFLAAWCIFEWPLIIGKITLLGNVPVGRAYLSVGFLGLLLLVRSLELMRSRFNVIVSIIVALSLAVFVTLASNIVFFEYYWGWMLLVMCGLLTLGILSILLFYKEIWKKVFCLFCIGISVFSGVFVNPVETGVDFLLESELIQEIQKISDTAGIDQKWVVEEDFPMGNYAIIAGAPTINSTNTYPNLAGWNAVDPEKKYEDIYNRYAQVSVKLQDNNETNFELTATDGFRVYLNINDLKKLNVKYILTQNDLDSFSNEKIQFHKIYELGEQKIYSLEN
ncbi:hypothetical protein SAMN04515624_1095 [Eubacterium maltosivorans]|uniref:DUF7657 domain-containing protein n=1 Tax=Eubacterium maltosivorans TaxID=2041044 RepID=UPI00088B4470|nr:hypothetical protein [Eubacterium maltosivorans]WPK79092.1 hypothetical protein EUMA32_04910 [Eubacterium maltosivorans]SDP31502.1 hypothetical protein SAMN04515624_1095 [Eubacterium maltosivorans]